jgi:nitrogen fixation/metabolism regulation signal transduction histidine kinase
MFDTAPPSRINTLAIVAFVLAFVVPLGGIICGHLALGQIKHTGEGGHGLALGGTIIGWVLTVFVAIVVVLVLLFSALAISEGYLTDPP